MKTKSRMLLLAAGITALGTYCYLPRLVAPSASAIPESGKITVTPPARSSPPVTALPEKAPARFPEKTATTATATPRNSKAGVFQPAPLQRQNGAPVRVKTASIPAGRHPDSPRTPKSEVIVPTAVRLSGKFRLPAGVMAQAMPDEMAGKTHSPQVKAASEAVVTQFYQEISRQASSQVVGKNDAAKGEPDTTDEPATANDVATHDGLESPTVVVEPDESTEQVRKSADESYRIFFGDESYNQHTMRSAIEVTLPEIR